MIKKLLVMLFTALCLSAFPIEKIDIAQEYSLDEFHKGITAFHNTEYELAITHFTKSLGYKENNYLSRYYLGESYRKAGYEENALFVWNALLAMGYEDRGLKNKITHLYNKRGMLADIYIDKDYVLREDIKGYLEDDKNNVELFIKPAQITVDKNNHYYIASYLTGAVVEFDPNLDVVRNFIPALPAIKNPFGVAVDNEGFIYVSDYTNDVILKLNRYNVVEKTIGFKGIGLGGLLGPKNLVFDEDENLYVNDSGNRRIGKYKKDGEFLFSFGNNIDDNNLQSPGGLFYDDGKLFVCDREQNAVLVFDKSGNYLYSLGADILKEPYDITRDNIGRLLILCKEKLWAYEESNALWYPLEETGKRLKRGTSIVSDKENNILITDFDTSRLLVLSLERQRYTNLNVNIERVFSQKFPEVHLCITVEKDDGSSPTGINTNNISIYENGKYVQVFGNGYTKTKNENTDITIIYDKNMNMNKNTNDFKTILDSWMKKASPSTKVCLVSTQRAEPVLENGFDSTRLQLLDSLGNKNFSRVTDKGSAIKTGIYHMLNRFSKKSLVIVTDGSETGNDFEMFKIDDCINLARNNDIRIYVVSFGNGPLSEIYTQIAKKTGGEYYRVYKSNQLEDLFQKIENSKGKELVISYRSESISRFGDEPVSVYLEIDYAGMKGIGQSIYYPEK